jgi:hypothetical protein
MKKILLLSFLTFLYCTSEAQKLKASLAAGSTPNRIKVLVKSSAAIEKTNISTLQFNVGINTAISPKPKATVIPNNTNFPSVTWQINEAEEAGYNNYSITTPNSPIEVASLNTTEEIEVMEIEFSDGPVDPQSISLVTPPGGGPQANLLFYCTGVPESDGTDLYFTRAGVTVVNGNSYEGSDISTATITGIVLPVKFLSFYALKSGSDAKLSWTVENDAENQYFDVERSIDGRAYSAFTRVNALNNGKSVNSYELADNGSLSSNLVYYRIKQVDKNGNTTYSLIRNLKLDKSTTVSLYPNPARTTTKLVFDAAAAGKASVTIRDLAGKQVQLLNIQLVKGINQQTLNVQTLPAGEYNVTIIGSNLKETVRLSRIN